MKKNVEIINNQLRQIMVHQQRAMTASLTAKMGLTPQQARALAVIQQHPGIIQRELADTFHRRSASISNLLHILERDGYIVRKIPADSGRTKKTYLTKKGEAAIEGSDTYFDETENLMVKNLSADEQKTLIALLDKVIKAYPEENTPQKRDQTKQQ